ncbi:MAG: hypothetical protein C5B53_03120 [Candidatus Melainabacteria bacterium]|nr:MAG: hypothetical protein C5B53_03120 [Candidatus Melainabacteria bacterium]
MSSEDRLSDGEIACIDAIKTILEVIISNRLITPEKLAEAYRFQANAYLLKDMPTASGAMMLLVQFLENQQRNAARELLNTSPEGEA